MQIPVKICGITSFRDASIAIDYGVSAVGFIFYKKSKRFIKPDIAVEWIQNVPKHVKRVGVFVDEEIDVISKIVDILGLDFIQLHGNESPEYCNLINTPVIKAFRVSEDFDINILYKYKVSAFLFDNYKKGEIGGTGEAFNWNVISKLKTSTPIILSGGLSYKNILNAIDKVSPSAIDLNSGVESAPGIKDEEKINKIFQKLRHTNFSENFFKKNK
tara:strand:- start:81 stop:728 length:648 start_codon:yes stop_codon:yes gene_type:complete